MINIPKGTKDVLPFESHKWQRVEGIAREVARLYNAKEVRTPVFEHTELFLRGVGETTDIVNKEMYTFEDKGGRSVTLKPEGTAGAVRAYIEFLGGESLPLKMFYFTPVFRYERPQAGRLREHHQFGVELFGAESAVMDAEAIMMAHEFLTRAGVKDIELYINSIGSGEGREAYNKALKSYLVKNEDVLCDKCRERMVKNPLRVLDCKTESCKAAVDGAPKTVDYLSGGDYDHFEELKKVLTARGIKYTVNPLIVRGLDYYTRTVFEFVTTTIGAQGTVCGGGRYDGLIGSLGGKPTPAVGFGLGLERLLLLMEANGADMTDHDMLDVFVAGHPSVGLEAVLAITASLRESGLSADYDQLSRSLKAQFKFASKRGAKFVVTVGAEELESGVFEVRDMAKGSAEKIQQDKIANYIKEQL